MKHLNCLLMLMFFSSNFAHACSGNISAKSQNLNLADLDSLRGYKHFLETSYQKGESGIADVVSIMEEGLSNNYSPCYMDQSYHASVYLLRYIQDGVRKKEISCLLLRAFTTMPLLQNRLPSAQALTLITGKNVGFNQNFIKNYSETDSVKIDKMIGIWKKEISCK